MPEPLTKEEVLAKLEKGESFQGVEIGDVDFQKYCFEKSQIFQKQFLLGEHFLWRQYF
ncbi:MAG: hypothetical protein H8E42_10385 [Nitrospinae bacterium]|nr:hypothetical protein [Nitrospinota bacterium]MBL7019522.1 hypothetical protein [Nitrospinaceae bacterium]